MCIGGGLWLFPVCVAVVRREWHDRHDRERRASAACTKQRNGVLTFLRDILIIFVAALLISFLIKTFLIRSFYIPSASMENTLQINDRIIVNELVPDTCR